MLHIPKILRFNRISICIDVVLLCTCLHLPVSATQYTLFAHWPFDETKNAAIASNSVDAARYAIALEGTGPGARGVLGNALELQGRHALRLDGFGLPEMNAITLSVWCRPTELGGYREILRQESGHRLLFSFQASGSILSLGLDIDGYIECDAPVELADIQGAWHHCAATFDGKFMRVYLDGREIGSLERPGTIALDPEKPAFIGSSSGASEHFQGRLDDMRVYTRALTPEQLTALYEEGNSVLEERRQQAVEQVNRLYTAKPTFAETLASMRKNIHKNKERLEEECTGAFVKRLRKDFPQDTQNFATWSGRTPVAYIMTSGNSFHYETVGHLMDLFLEYKPLTEAQWAKQTPEDKRHWEKAEELQQQFEQLKEAGLEARFSPEWIALILEMGQHIDFRPTVQEAVAPYVKPATPETRDRTPDEAQKLLEQDWLHQVDDNPTPTAIRNEIRWTRALMKRIEQTYPGQTDFTDIGTQLDVLAQQAMTLSNNDDALYFQVRSLKRDVMFANPVVDFDRILFVDMPYPQGSEWPHETRHQLGYMAVPGGKIVVLDGLHPDGHVRQLMPQLPLHGSFWRPDLSFDAQKVLFCFKPHNEKSFHLYEINVDGTGLTQLTDGPYDDFDPIYLPDETHIIFSTTRGHTYVRCMPPTNAFVLARANRDGSSIYLISANNEPDYLPSLMHDGRIVYTRWEYTDKPLWRAQSLWSVNPDGAQPNTLWGNQSVWPDLLKDARAIPGSHRIMFTGSAHHHWFHGSVGIIDPEAGLNFPNGLTKVTADVEWPECGNGPVDPIESFNYHAAGKYNGYYSPYPLSEQDFLVSADRDGKFVLYLMDVDGNRELIYEGDNHIFYAMPLKPRPRPPVIPDRAQFPTAEERDHPAPGIIYSANVYQGAPEVLRGKARYLRILNIDHKTYTYWHKRPYLSTGPVVSVVQSEGVKRILGTVPIAPDGSVSFYAPSGIPLHFQLLDEEHRALQTMRSFVNVMPGESRGCLGCHELHSRTPEVQTGTTAITQPPVNITPPPWPDNTVSYARYVRPVLDKYCVKCHEGDGKGRKTFDMTERSGSPIFTEPYLTMIGKPSWGAAYKAPKDPPPGFGIAGQLMVEGYDQRDPKGYTTPEPMTALSYKSKLIEIASSGNHHDVKVDEISRLRLINWVDAMTPYRGLEEIREIPDPEFQGIDWLAVRPRIKTAPIIMRPGPLD